MEIRRSELIEEARRAVFEKEHTPTNDESPSRERTVSDRRERDALATELAAADPEPYDGTHTADEYYMQYARNIIRAREKASE